jgi:glycosyltransferase involved in cell wall biosynthesis
MDETLHVYAPGYGPALDLYRGFADVHVVRYERLMLPRSPGYLAGALVGLVRDVATFRRLFREHGIDTAICATTVTPAAAVAARTLGIALVIYCGEVFEKGPAASAGRRLASGALSAIVPRLADLVVCCSDLAAAQFRRDRRASIVRLYPPIEPNSPVVERSDARRKFGLPVDSPVVAVVGGLSPVRGQDVAISALELLRDGASRAVLAIAGAPGEGPGDARYADDLVGRAARAGLERSVRFLGPVGDIGAFLSAADVVVNPARFAEPFGRVAFEALALGVPAVVTRTGAQTELLRDGQSALVVPPDDPAAMAHAIARILESPTLAGDLVRGAAESLAALDPDRDRERFRQLLDDATEVNGAQARG